MHHHAPAPFDALPSSHMHASQSSFSAFLVITVRAAMASARDRVRENSPFARGVDPAAQNNTDPTRPPRAPTMRRHASIPMYVYEPGSEEQAPLMQASTAEGSSAPLQQPASGTAQPHGAGDVELTVVQGQECSEGTPLLASSGPAEYHSSSQAQAEGWPNPGGTPEVPGTPARGPSTSGAASDAPESSTTDMAIGVVAIGTPVYGFTQLGTAVGTPIATAQGTPTGSGHVTPHGGATPPAPASPRHAQQGTSSSTQHDGASTVQAAGAHSLGTHSLDEDHSAQATGNSSMASPGAHSLECQVSLGEGVGRAPSDHTHIRSLGPGGTADPVLDRTPSSSRPASPQVRQPFDTRGEG